VIVAVKLHRAERSLDPGRLQWGVEETVRTAVKLVGTARQPFLIETKPSAIEAP
jgi:hypothetical protein